MIEHKGRIRLLRRCGGGTRVVIELPGRSRARAEAEEEQRDTHDPIGRFQLSVVTDTGKLDDVGLGNELPVTRDHVGSRDTLVRAALPRNLGTSSAVQRRCGVSAGQTFARSKDAVGKAWTKRSVGPVPSTRVNSEPPSEPNISLADRQAFGLIEPRSLTDSLKHAHEHSTPPNMIYAARP